MVSGFDIWGHDAGLRRHWKYRFMAFTVDGIISFVPVSIVLYLLGINDILQFGIIVSTAFYLVSCIPESVGGSSVGKRIFHFQVHAIDDSSVAGRVWLRNISRLFWFILPPLDLTLGMATRGDPRQRMLDRMAGTKVVHREEKEKYTRHMEALARKDDAGDEEAKKDNAKDDNTKDANSGSRSGEEKCQECGGRLILLADDKLQCENCGVIQ